MSDAESDRAARGPYHSPLRTRQKEQTGDLILGAVADILRATDLSAVTIAHVAQVAGVTERTVYRHFSTREDLLRAFWKWQLERTGGQRVIAPESMDELLGNIRRLFSSLDAEEGVVRALVGTIEGRDVRRAVNQRRLEHMLAFTEPFVVGMSEHDQHSLAAGIISVCSVLSWLFMRDNCDYDGARAGESAAFAVRMMIEGAQAYAERLRSDETSAADVPG